jgi:phosphonate transport system substrate-binding protein
MSARRLWAVFAAASVCLIVVLAWLFRPGQPDIPIPQDDELVQARSNKDDIWLAVAPVLSPEETFDSYRVIAGWLARELDQPVRLVQRRTYDQVNQLLAEGTVHFALVCTGAYLEAVRSGVALEPILIPVHPGGPVYYSMIIVRADSEFESIEDVLSKRWAFADPLSLTGHYYPLAMAMEAGVDPHEVLPNVSYTYSHHDSMHAVLDGIADAAAVDSHVFDFEMKNKPDVADQIRVIHRSPPLGIQPIVAAPSVDPALVIRFRDALVKIGETSEGRQLMDQLGFSGFVEPPPGLWDGASRVYLSVVDHIEANP